MMLQLVAAAALAAAPQNPDVTSQTAASAVAPVTVHPLPNAKTPPAATVEVPADDSAGGHWASIWPHDAYVERIGGRVILTCDIDRYGIAEWCQVAAETPPRKGFGQAALEMRPSLKVPPPRGPDGPTDAVENIAINFRPPQGDADFAGAPVGDFETSSANFSMLANQLSEKQSITVLNNPVWASAASHADVEAAYPRKGGGVEGFAVDHCQVDGQGRLSRCQVIKEAPEDHGFGKAAISLAARFRVAPQWSVAPHRAELWTDVPIRFPPPGETEPRSVRAPYWVAGFDPAQALKVYPPEAADKGVTTGRGVAECTVATDGGLAGCKPDESDPAGLGFGEAAARLASTMRMNPWTRDGAPVDGATVLVTIRLNLEAGS